MLPCEKRSPEMASLGSRTCAEAPHLCPMQCARNRGWAAMGNTKCSRQMKIKTSQMGASQAFFSNEKSIDVSPWPRRIGLSSSDYGLLMISAPRLSLVHVARATPNSKCMHELQAESTSRRPSEPHCGYFMVGVDPMQVPGT